MSMVDSNCVLLTGSDGFLGRSFTSESPELDIVPFDVTNGDVATFDFSVYKAGHVVHLAARTSVEESWEIPAEYYQTNIMGTLNLLEYCRKIGASMTYLSTYTYGKPEYLPIDEQHPVSPHSVYNHSKYMAEDMCRFYAENLGVPVSVLRLFNLYGPGQSTSFLIPNIVRQVFEDEQIVLLDLMPKRDYVYITDVIEALRLSLGKRGFNLYNVGSGISFSVSELCKIVQECAGTQKAVMSKNITRKNEVMDVVADCSKIKTELGWTPKVSIYDGIKRVVEDYRIERQMI